MGCATNSSCFSRGTIDCVRTATISDDPEGRNRCRVIMPHPLFPGVHTLPVSLPADWSSLPLELVGHAALMLSWKDICNLALVNKACRSVANSQIHWGHLFRQRFGRPNPDRTPACWKHLFRLNHEAFTGIVWGRQPECSGISSRNDFAINLRVTA